MSDEISDQDSTEMSMAIMLALGKQCPQKMTDMVNDMGEYSSPIIVTQSKTTSPF